MVCNKPDESLANGACSAEYPHGNSDMHAFSSHRTNHNPSELDKVFRPVIESGDRRWKLPEAISRAQSSYCSSYHCVYVAAFRLVDRHRPCYIAPVPLTRY